MKTCSRCGVRKSRSKFYKHPRSKDGLQSYCIPCHKEANQASRERNREKDRERSARWRANNPQKVKEKRDRYYQKNKEKLNANRRKQHFLEKYDLLPTELAELQKKSKGHCMICRKKVEKLCVDHNHRTGEVRGMLCQRCNLALGQFNDDPRLLKSALAYLGKTA